MPQSYLKHVIAEFETLDGIASTYLGDGNQWPVLAQVNNLRYPYLSNDPRERSGLLLASTTIRRVLRTVSVQGTPTTITGVAADDLILAVADDLRVIEGQQVLLLDFTSDAGPNTSLVPVLGMIHAGPAGPIADPQVYVAYTPAQIALLPPPPLIVLQAATGLAWPAGIEVSLHEDPTQDPTQVLGPGDILLIPQNATGTALPQSRLTDWDELLGIDIAIDAAGQLGYDQSGDLALVAGIPNLDQALSNRLVSAPGDLPLHPDYGNVLVTQLGRILPETLTLANAYARAAVLADPRIGAVQRSSAAMNLDTLRIDLTASVQSSEALLDVSAILHTGGN